MHYIDLSIQFIGFSLSLLLRPTLLEYFLCNTIGVPSQSLLFFLSLQSSTVQVLASDHDSDLLLPSLKTETDI